MIPVHISIKCPFCNKLFEDFYGCYTGMNFSKEFYSDFKTGTGGRHVISELFLYSCNNCGFTERTVFGPCKFFCLWIHLIFAF